MARVIEFDTTHRLHCCRFAQHEINVFAVDLVSYAPVFPGTLHIEEIGQIDFRADDGSIAAGLLQHSTERKFGGRQKVVTQAVWQWGRFSRSTKADSKKLEDCRKAILRIVARCHVRTANAVRELIASLCLSDHRNQILPGHRTEKSVDQCFMVDSTERRLAEPFFGEEFQKLLLHGVLSRAKISAGRPAEELKVTS